MGSLVFFILMHRVVRRLDTTCQQRCLLFHHYHLNGWLLIKLFLHKFVVFFVDKKYFDKKMKARKKARLHPVMGHKRALR